ncbi:MAG: DMT family transporter [Xanthobacteraceae bacterium]|jgi:drug/metabolite transporter (DMT)-like permease
MESDSTRERLAALVPGIVAAASFGVCDAIVKLVFAAGIDVLTLALIRGVVGVVILYFYLRFGATPEPATPRMRNCALVLGVLFAAIVYGLFKAIDLITVPIAVLTYFIYPLLTGIGGAALGIERLGWHGALAALVAFLGLALTIGAYPQALSIEGLSFAVGAALCRTIFLLVARIELQKLDPRLTTWYSLLSSTAIFAIGAVVTLNWHSSQTAEGWILAFVVGIGTAIAILTLYMSTIRIGPFRSALIMNLEPLLATLLSAPLLGEVLTPIQGIGAAIMLGAIVAFQMWR